MKTIKKYDIDADIGSKVLKILELTIQFPETKKGSKKKKILGDACYTVHSSQCKSVKSLGKHCYNFVIKCISNHRYEEAAKLYWILCQNKSISEHDLFKIGVIILSNLELNDKNHCFLNFFHSMLNFRLLNKKETVLEFMMCAIKYEFPDIQKQVKELTNMKFMDKTRKHHKIDSLFEAYIVLLEWCNFFCDDKNISQSQTNKQLSKLKNYNEDSDIFILKFVKVLELCDRQNEVENELFNFVETNPGNVNALIYICTYLYHNHPESDKLLIYLEILADKCVSDMRTLWLIEIWEKRGVSSLKVLKYCFMFLDYPTNGNNIKAWEALWKNLSKAKLDLAECDLKSIYSLWEPRKRSWTWMYFNPQQLPNMQLDDKLIAFKVAVLLIFEDGKKYIKKVAKYHPDALELAKSLKN